MPWVGNTYSLPAGTTVSPNTTIQSTWANTLTSDLQSGMNFTRPVSRGGTGATTASEARNNLGVGPGKVIKFDTVADLLVDTTIDYGSAELDVAEGQIVEAQGFRYEVVASDASEFDEETAGGVRLVLRAKPVNTLPQPLTDGEQDQARVNIGFRPVSYEDYVFGSIKDTQTIIATASGTDEAQVREHGNVLYDPDDAAAPYKFVYSGNAVPYAQNNVWVFGATSVDGKSWSKVGKLFTRPSEDPFLVKHSGTYYIFCEDKNTVPSSAIMLFSATNFSGPWTDEGVILDKNGSAPGWESQDVGSPVVIVEDGVWNMLYEGRGAGYDQIGLATAPTPTGPWTRSANNPVIASGECWGWSENYVLDDIIRVRGTYVVTAHNTVYRDPTDLNTGGYVVGIGISSDLENWTDPLGHPVSTPSPSTRVVAHYLPLNGDLYVVTDDRDVGIQLSQVAGVPQNYSCGIRPGSSFSLGTGINTDIPLTSILSDPLGGFSGSTYVVQQSGLYEISTEIQLNSSGSGRIATRVRLNDDEYIANFTTWTGTTSGQTIGGHDLVYLRAGDTLTLMGYAQAGNSGNVSASMKITQLH